MEQYILENLKRNFGNNNKKDEIIIPNELEVYKNIVKDIEEYIDSLKYCTVRGNYIDESRNGVFIEINYHTLKDILNRKDILNMVKKDE